MLLNKESLVRFLVLILIIPFYNGFSQTPDLNSSNGKALVIEKSYKNSTIDGYNIFIPNSYDGKNKMPLIMFLQGGSGVGGSVGIIYHWALPNLLLSNMDTELNSYLDDFIYVMPHIKSGQFYNNESAIRDIIEELSNEYNIDNNRIYLTGLSRGGYGTWGLASKMTDVFAAIAPICGGARGIENYDSLLNYPIWASHNTGDPLVKHEFSLNIIKKLEEHGKIFQKVNKLSMANYKYLDKIFVSTISDDHDAWTDFYKNKNFYKWLLRFKKGN